MSHQHGFSALHWASFNGKHEIVSLLLGQGASLNARNKVHKA
jgi:ankyrin repeat protein